MLLRHVETVVVVVVLAHVETECRIEAVETRNGTNVTNVIGTLGRGRDFKNNGSMTGHYALALAIDLTLDLVPVLKIKERNGRGDVRCLRAVAIPRVKGNDGNGTRRTSGKKVESGGKRKREKKRKGGTRFIIPLCSDKLLKSQCPEEEW